MALLEEVCQCGVGFEVSNAYDIPSCLSCFFCLVIVPQDLISSQLLLQHPACCHVSHHDGHELTL